jgi:hypothetical protein
MSSAVRVLTLVSIRKLSESPPPLTGEGQGGGDKDCKIRGFRFYFPLTPALSREGMGVRMDTNLLSVP